jgi:hypothetical protein
MREVAVALHARRRLVAALLGAPEPPRVLRPLLGGVLLSALLVGATVLRHRW